MKKNRSWKGILIIVLLLAIGFATVTTTLFINGTIKFGANQSDFDLNLKFKTAKLEYSDATKTAKVHGTDGVEMIATDGKSITFEVDPLKVIGETATLTYTIENKSQYHANLRAIDCKVKKDVTDAANAWKPAEEGGNGVDVTSAVLNPVKDETTGKYPEYIKLTPQATVGTRIPAYNGVSDPLTIEVKMIQSFAGTADFEPTEAEPEEVKSYLVKCDLVADAEAAEATTAAATTTTTAATPTPAG